MNLDPSQLNWKKILLIIGFVLVCLGLIFLMYLMFFKPAPTTEAPGQTNVPSGANLPNTGENTGLEQLGSGTGQLPNVATVEINGQTVDNVANGSATKATALNNDQTLGMQLSADGQNVVYYDRDDERFYKISADGEKILLSTEKFLQLKDVAWSNDTSAAIVTYPDDLKIYYNFATNKKVTLPKSLVEPIFNDAGNNISFKYETSNTDNNYIAVSRPDGTGAKLVEPLGDEGKRVQTTFAPDGSVVAFYAKPTGLDSSEIYFIGQQGENFRSLKIAGTNFKAIWSPSGQKIVYQSVAAATGYRPNLFVAGVSAGNPGSSLDLDLQTWVDKCVFAGENDLYCAVPESLPDAAGLYTEIIENEKDSIYRLNLATGAKEKIADPIDDSGATIFNISRLSVSADGATLFFWDENTGKVYKIRLR